MKIDRRSLKLFNIKKEVYSIAILRVISFLCFLYFSYNFVDFLFEIINTKQREQILLSCILKAAIALIVFYFTKYYDNKLSHKISQKIRKGISFEIYDKVEKLSLNYTNAVSTGNLVVMNSSSLANIEMYFNKFIPQIYATMLIVLSSLIIYSAISIYLSIAMLILYPLIPISIMVILKKSKKVNKKTFSDFLSLSELFYDRLKGFDIAKIYGKEDNINREIDRRSENYRVSTMQLLKHQLNSINIMDATSYISIFVMGVISITVLKNPALIIFVIVASFECFKPLRVLGGLFHISMRANVEFDNIYKLLDYKEEEKENSILLEKGKDIEFKGVSFAYNKNNVLENINIKLKKGTKVALVGESGSGKSTIIKLIMGLITPVKGEITYGNKNLSKISFKELTKQMTVITSDSYLNNASIREHLKINENITEEQMYRALEKVNLKEFALEKGGLDYKLTSGGGNLSGGQKQRLLAAKAILKDSYIYILDEAVSNIDDYSKEIVLKAFDSIKQDKIIIIVSHDLLTTKNCDNIYVLKDKKIIEEGNYNKLTKEETLYKKLLEEQENLKNKYLLKGGKDD